LKKSVVLVHVILVKNVGCKVVVDQPLPWNWQTEDIEAILVGKVLHLTGSHIQTRALVLAIVGGLWAVGNWFPNYELTEVPNGDQDVGIVASCFAPKFLAAKS
jgi:hypothetical protein